MKSFLLSLNYKLNMNADWILSPWSQPVYEEDKSESETVCILSWGILEL